MLLTTGEDMIDQLEWAVHAGRQEKRQCLALNLLEAVAGSSTQLSTAYIAKQRDAEVAAAKEQLAEQKQQLHQSIKQTEQQLQQLMEQNEQQAAVLKVSMIWSIDP